MAIDSILITLYLHLDVYDNRQVIDTSVVTGLRLVLRVESPFTILVV